MRKVPVGRITAFLNAYWRWSIVSKFMRLRISQAAASIPLIGYLLLWSDRVQSFLALHPTLQKIELFGTITRLKLVYAGSFFLAAAWVLYQYGCDAIIKRHPAEQDYLSEQTAINDQLTFGQVVGEVEQYTVRGANEVEARFSERTPELVKLLTHAEGLRFASTHPQHQSATMHRAYYVARERRHPRALAACFACIGIGLACLALPSFEVFVLVMRRFFLGM